MLTFPGCLLQRRATKVYPCFFHSQRLRFFRKGQRRQLCSKIWHRSRLQAKVAFQGRMRLMRRGNKLDYFLNQIQTTRPTCDSAFSRTILELERALSVKQSVLTFCLGRSICIGPGRRWLSNGVLFSLGCWHPAMSPKKHRRNGKQGRS